MLDIWISIDGNFKILKASLIATDVWVNAAALIITPLLSTESWILFTISPSIFDWKNKVFKFNSFA